MTEHIVLRRATDARADLQHRRELALIALDAIDEEISEVERFIDMYHRFSGVTVEEPAFEQATNADIRGVACEQSQEVAGPREFAPPDARRPWGADEPFENALLDKLCAFDPSWPDDIKVKWFDAFDKLRAIHLPNNSNNAPAEDARLEDGLSPSKEGGTTSAATDDSVGTSVPSADPDGGGSNSTIPREGTPGKSAGETDGSPAAPLTKKERVAQTHQEHPGWTTAQIATHLNLSRGAVSSHLYTLRIKLGHKGSPRKKAPGEPTVREKVLALRNEHPDWLQRQIADALGIGTGSVSKAVKGLDIQFPKSANSLPKADSLRAQVEAYVAGHPEATTRDAADALGLSPNRVRAISVEAGIQLRKLTPEEMQAARRAGALKSAAVRRGDSALPADDGAESRRRKYGEPDRAPGGEPAPQPFTAGDQDEEPIAPAPRPRVLSEPKGRFYLRTAAGKYLHMSGSGLVDGRSYAWCGNQKQFEALRDKFEMARDPAFVKYVPDLTAVRA